LALQEAASVLQRTNRMYGSRRTASSAKFFDERIEGSCATAPGSILELNIGSRSPSILSGDRP
jgi:hypothetical protein